MKLQKRTKKMLAFTPALIAICATAYVASGVSVVGSATGASTVDVSGTVGSSFSADPDVSGCAAQSVGGSFATAAAMSAACPIKFSSNNGTGSELVFENDNVATDLAFFCADPDRDDSVPINGPLARDCSAAGNRVEDATAAPQAIASNRFGLALESVTGDTGGLGGTGVAAPDSSPTTGESIWVGVPDLASPAQMCRYPGPNTSTGTTCTFRFGAQGQGATQGAGHYTGTLRLTARLT